MPPRQRRPLTAWLQVPPNRFHLTAGQPRPFASSSHCTRFSCPACGSPLSMTDHAGHAVGITICTLDHPEHASPTVHGCTQHQLSWLKLADNLPRHDDSPPYDL